MFDRQALFNNAFNFCCIWQTFSIIIFWIIFGNSYQGWTIMIASGAHNKKVLSLSFIKITYVPVIFLCITNSILTYKIKFLEKNLLFTILVTIQLFLSFYYVKLQWQKMVVSEKQRRRERNKKYLALSRSVGSAV